MTDVINKIDLKTFIGDLEKEEEPKTLAEIHAEVGFPFAAKVVDPNGKPGVHKLPVGTEMLFTGRDEEGDFISPYYDRWILGNIPRWQLLGHKT